MSRPAPEIQLSTEEKETLLHWMRSTKTEQRMVERARVIFLVANGLNGKGDRSKDGDPHGAREQVAATIC
jgi:hypothetical protein